jgi:hypothetical protein
MERLNFYQNCVRELVKRHSESEAAENGIQSQVVIDTENNHYQVLDIGWEGMKRIYHCFIHLDIQDGKIWIQRNMTEADLAQELLEMGVPKDDIILGLHPPYKRPYTGYGVA